MESGLPSDHVPGDRDKHAALPQKRLRYLLLMGAALLLMLALVFVFQRPTNFEEYIRQSGFGGVFLMAIIGSASPIWPLPGATAAFIAGGLGLNPILVGLAAGIGEPAGELLYFTAGYGGQAVARRFKAYARIEKWMRKRAGLTIFLVSAVPNVFIKLATSVAGMLNYPLWKFFLACWAGKTIKSLGFAFAGWGLFAAVKSLIESIF